MIAVDDLYYRYPHHADETLRGVTCRFPDGSLTLVSGPTGSAKTTLAFALCGAIPHLLGGRLTGQVLIDGSVVHQQPVRESARRVGLIMQNVQWQTVMDRVDDEIAFGLENFAVPADRMNAAIDAAAERVGARHLLHRRLDTLSAGERQRVALAASLALDQPALLLDEPLAFLDRTATGQLMQVLGGLRDRGRTVVVFEHRWGEVSPRADRHLTLSEGRVHDGRCQAMEFSGCLVGQPPGPCRLVFEDVACDLPDRRLFHGVSFEVRGGRSAVLLGDNGSGKTTLLRLAMGLMRASAGRITTCGQPAGGTPTRRLAARAALVLQHPDQQLFLRTVEQEVQWTAADPAAAAREIAAFRLDPLRQRHPQSMSMGQKRRLTVAAALARRPDLLMLDEPTVGQDDQSLSWMIDRLIQYVHEGGALLTATHDARVARALGQDVIVLHGGTSRCGGPDVMTFFHEANPSP